MRNTRRDFLSKSALFLSSSVLGAGALSKKAQAAAVDEAGTGGSLPKKTLGRTGLEITTISVGTGSANANTIKYAIDRGINFIHTSINYSKGRSIEEVGQGIKGKRDKVYLGLKITWDWNSDEILNRALDILGTDYVDILFFNIHDNPKKIASPETKAAFRRWKEQGKVRFLGLTTHKAMKEGMESALKAGWYDCLMPSYQLNLRDSFKDVFKECQKKNVGVVAMKTKISEGDTSAAPVFLSDKPVTTICRTMNSLSQVKAYIQGIRQKVSQAECQEIINQTRIAAIGRCGMCGGCSRVCKNNLAVSDIVRSVDYYVDTIKDYDYGQDSYLDIAVNKNAAHCLDCGSCEEVCPNNVPIRSFVNRADKLYVNSGQRPEYS